MRMYATVRRYAGGADLADALVEREGEVRDLISGIGGFVAYYMVRADDGDSVSISVFESADSAAESNRVAAGWIRENLPDLPISAPQVSAGEVAISF
jgi:hypothetical protein